METTRKVDQSALKVNQAFIIAFLVLGFVLNAVWLVVFVAAVMLVGTAVPALSLFKGVYTRALRPSGLVKANIIADNPEPHRFAQGFGGVVLLGAIAALWAGATTLGWALVGLVVYYLYGYRKSHVGRGIVDVPELSPDAPPGPVAPMPGAPAPGDRQH